MAVNLISKREIVAKLFVLQAKPILSEIEHQFILVASGLQTDAGKWVNISIQGLQLGAKDAV